MNGIKLISLPPRLPKADYDVLVDQVKQLLYGVRPELKITEALGILEMAKHTLLLEQDEDE